MPMDNYVDDGDEKGDADAAGAKRVFKDFDCPDCNANNPSDPAFGDGDELLCNYCGSSFVAKVNEDGRLKLKEA